MKDQSKYIVMGDDGNEYGPVSAEQIRDWIADNRIERKTPVKTETTKDWIFIESLPEFRAAFEAVAPANKTSGGSRKWLLLLFLLALAGVVFFLFKK